MARLSPYRAMLALAICQCFAAQAFASLDYTTSTFQNFAALPGNPLLGFAATADVFQSGTKVGVITASVTYGGGTNPFNSGSLWGAAGTFRATGQSVNDDSVTETADGFWQFDIVPEAGWQVDGLTLFTNGTVIANPTFAGLTSNGTATVRDNQQGTAEELLSNYQDGDSFVDGDDLIFNPGTLSTGITGAAHSQQWAYNSAGATSLAFTYEAGPVSNITNEGIVLDLQFSSTSTPEPSSLWLLGMATAFGLRTRRRRNAVA